MKQYNQESSFQESSLQEQETDRVFPPTMLEIRGLQSECHLILSPNKQGS